MAQAAVIGAHPESIGDRRLWIESAENRWWYVEPADDQSIFVVFFRRGLCAAEIESADDAMARPAG